jgi:parallel beta-helix repeat protein
MSARSQKFKWTWEVTCAVLAAALGGSAGAMGAPAVPIADPFIPPPGQELASPRYRAATLAAKPAPLAGRGGVLEVDDNRVQCPRAQYTAIQDAVDAAALLPGVNEVHVCEGTYAEDISIGPGNSLRITGDGTGKTFVTGAGGTAGPIIGALGAGRVDISHLTVDGRSMMAGDPVYGIRYTDTDGDIRDVKVLNIRNPDGSSQGIGLLVGSATASASVNVADCVVQNYTRTGIEGNGSGVNLNVAHSVVLGPTPARVWAPNGIQLSRGADGEVMNNVVNENASPNVDAGAGSNIILFCAGSAHVHNNVVRMGDLGITMADNPAAHVHNNEVDDSGMDGISLQFIGLYFGGPLGCTPSISPAQDNFVHDNRIMNSRQTGISLANFDRTSAASTPNDNLIRNNSVDGSGTDGIHVFHGEDNELKNNRIDASGDTDAVDDTSGGGSAGTADTWKNNKCSTSSPDSLCK